ncbi:MAG: nuclear transport factor 2 family protein, partial [Bacteroidota bacterium]|nr:nuclear transport factor 2 family protein [Bacteroidota bacterium]
YPDYLEYDWRDSNAVQSWWDMGMKRNSDGKEVVLKVLFIDWFDKEGKIERRFLYWNKSLLD